MMISDPGLATQTQLSSRILQAIQKDPILQQLYAPGVSADQFNAQGARQRLAQLGIQVPDRVQISNHDLPMNWVDYIALAGGVALGGGLAASALGGPATTAPSALTAAGGGTSPVGSTLVQTIGGPGYTSLFSAAPHVAASTVPGAVGTLGHVLGTAIPAGIGTIGSIIGARTQAASANRAADLQTQAANHAADLQAQSAKQALDFQTAAEAERKAEWEKTQAQNYGIYQDETQYTRGLETAKRNRLQPYVNYGQGALSQLGQPIPGSIGSMLSRG